MISRTTGSPAFQTRLDSWKSIAQYLSRSPRTVQRWHSEYGMPVYHIGGDAGSVFVYTEELDEWLRNRSQPESNKPLEFCKPMLHDEPLSQCEQVQCNEASCSDTLSRLQTLNSQELVIHADRMWQSNSSSNLGAMAQVYRRAADLDPENAYAYAGLSLVLISEGILGCVRTTIAFNCAEAALRRAMQIDPELIEVKCAAAWLKMFKERDWDGARQGLNEVISQRSEYSPALVGQALLHIAEGCLPEALDLLLKVINRNPLKTPVIAIFCWCNYLAGQYDQALAWNALARKLGHGSALFDALAILVSVQLEGPSSCIQRIKSLPTDSSSYSVLQGLLGYAYGMTGQTEKAREILNAFIDSEAQIKPHHAYSIALTLIGLDEKQKATEWLERTYCYGSLWSLGLLADPILTPLRNEPSYRLFLSRVSYPTPENCNPVVP